MSTTAFYSNKDEIYSTYHGNDLGSVYTPECTVFKVWAPSAEQVLLKLYSTGSFYEEGAQVISIKQMLYDASTGVWSAAIDGDLKGVYYTYVIKTEKGTHETQDVYSRAVGVNSTRSEVVDLKATDPEGWDSDRHVLPDKPNDAVIWEIHVRDFSSSDTSGVSKEHRGKFLAFTEENTVIPFTSYPTCVNYLKQLGITHVQLNPVFDFGSVNEITGVEYNWGYDPVNYNVPEGSYSTDPYHGEVRIKEFKQMVMALHKAGIGVIMDVVYNHVYSTADSPFEKTVPGYYFRMQDGKFLNSSGCGNVTASDKVMFRKFMIDSLRYWVEEYHIDGFRFDLMACHDIDTLNEIRAELDKIDKRILMYGEPWTANDGENGISGEDCCNKSNAKKLSDRIGMFNDDMRHGIKGGSDDDSKGFIQGSTHSAYNVIAGMMGASSVTFGNWANEPSQCITYASAHDNLTLWDKILKSNWCDDFNTTDKLYIGQNKLAAVLILSSMGIPFMLAGEEFARTKRGDHNSYKSPDSINSINWTRIVRYSQLVDYYKGLIQIRKAFSPLRDNTTKAVNDGYIVYNGQTISLTIKNDTEGEWKMISVIINNSDNACAPQIKSQYELPKRWYIIANGDSASANAIDIFDPEDNIPPHSALIIVDADSYDKINGTEPLKIEKKVDAKIEISSEIKEMLK